MLYEDELRMACQRITDTVLKFYEPCQNRSHADVFQTTSELVNAYQENNPDLDINYETLNDYLTESGFKLFPIDLHGTLSLKWALRER